LGDLNDKERKALKNATMNKCELILDDIKALKQQTTCFLHPEQPVYIGLLLRARNYFDCASAPQPSTLNTQPTVPLMMMPQCSMVLIWRQNSLTRMK